MKQFILASLIVLTACADTGSRGSRPDAKVGKFSVYWWGEATATERLYLIETTSEHVQLLGQHLAGPWESVPETDIIFYRTRKDVAAARYAVQASYGGAAQPYVLNPLLQFSGVGFKEPWSGTIHIWAGAKLEADQLGHMMLHRVIADDAHLDPRWQRFLTEDYLLSLTIAGRR